MTAGADEQGGAGAGGGQGGAVQRRHLSRHQAPGEMMTHCYMITCRVKDTVKFGCRPTLSTKKFDFVPLSCPYSILMYLPRVILGYQDSYFSTNPDYESKLKSLKDMGVDEGAARVALSSCSWDVNRATEQLFN